jgi:hypothetical protein
VAYREENAERARIAEQERRVAGWLRTMEATRARRAGRSKDNLGVWLLILAGPIVGAGVAGLATVLWGCAERSAFWILGGFVGFVFAVALAFRRTLGRRDGLEP